MAETDFFEQIKLFLPKYLTPAQTAELFSELSKFPENMSFYLSHSAWQDELLQGDGWHGFVAINFESGERRSVAGMVISNSCDIFPGNVRDLPINVLFSPLIEVSRLVERLRAGGKESGPIADMMAGVRKQRVTQMFYLPEYSGVWSESVVLLDNIHAHPLQHFLTSTRRKLFTLTQYAFYLFLMKLSIHLSRFQEDVQRFDGP